MQAIGMDTKNERIHKEPTTVSAIDGLLSCCRHTAIPSTSDPGNGTFFNLLQKITTENRIVLLFSIQ